MVAVRGSLLKGAGLESEASFRESGFSRTLGGLDLKDVSHIVSAFQYTQNWVFTVVQTEKAIGDKQKDAIKAGLQVGSPVKVKAAKGGREHEYYPIEGPLDPLTSVLVQGIEPRPNLNLYFVDSKTLVFADRAPMEKFLEDDARPEIRPEHKTKPATPPTTTTPGGPGTLPGGPGGAPLTPGAT